MASNPDTITECPHVREEFKPNPEILKQLLGLGYTEPIIAQALAVTGNVSADLAVSWILDTQQQSDVEGMSDEELDEDDFYKMVLVVNTELKMGTGKMAAQVAHATLGVYRKMMADQQVHAEALLLWEQYGESKIVLKGDSATQLFELAARANEAGIPHYIVEDAGRTQIPEGSVTVLGMLGGHNDIDKITGKLRLLN